jgi:F-type H+-transporting ATPase subunit b
MMDVLERIGVHLPSLVIYLVNFLVLWGVLHFVAFRPFMRRLRQRTLEEEERRAGMQELRQLREEAEQSRNLVLAQAREERETILRAAEELRDNLVKDGVERGKQAKERLFRQAQEQILLETLKAHQSLYDSFVELVLAASERALGKALDEAMQQKLIAEANRELADLTEQLSSLLPKGWALVTTAVPLVQECQDKI